MAGADKGVWPDKGVWVGGTTTCLGRSREPLVGNPWVSAMAEISSRTFDINGYIIYTGRLILIIIII